MEFETNQEKLMEMIVDKVFEKHKVKVDHNNLSSEEKEEVKNVVESIKKDVNRFLENQNKKKTEKDFPAQNKNIVTEPQQAPVQKPRNIFSQPNDISAVKSFLNKRKF